MNLSFKASPESAGSFRSAGATISTVAAYQRPKTCRTSFWRYARAERFAEIAPGSLQQVLITEYTPGASIGWHKDRSVFGDVVGISLMSACTFRLRLKAGHRWQRRKLTIEPRSVYLLRGPARSEWEHSIPGVDSLRYSITFRNVLEKTSPEGPRA